MFHCRVRPTGRGARGLRPSGEVLLEVVVGCGCPPWGSGERRGVMCSFPLSTGSGRSCERTTLLQVTGADHGDGARPGRPPGGVQL